jgi:hypothetical protein
LDNFALDVAVQAANALEKPVVVFFAPRPFPPANLRHYAFLAQGISDIAESLAKRAIGFVLRRFPDHSLLRFCDEVKPALVVGDENPIREAEGWRRIVAKKLKVPLWTVDADVIVPSKLLEKEQYAAFIIRPRLEAKLGQFLVALANPEARLPWTKPPKLHLLPADCNITEGWDLDRSSNRHQSGKAAPAKRCAFWETSCSTSCPDTPATAITRNSTAPLGSRPICTSGTSVQSPSPSPGKTPMPPGRQRRIPEPGHHLARTLREPGPVQSQLRQFRMR